MNLKREIIGVSHAGIGLLAKIFGEFRAVVSEVILRIARKQWLSPSPYVFDCRFLNIANHIDFLQPCQAEIDDFESKTPNNPSKIAFSRMEIEIPLN